jgi:hypothetical protein
MAYAPMLVTSLAKGRDVYAALLAMHRSDRRQRESYVGPDRVESPCTGVANFFKLVDHNHMEGIGILSG